MRSGDDMLRQIVDKSALDPDFRQQLLADPKATISEELGITIPASMNVKIHESDMQTVHVALPPDPEHHRRAARSSLGRPLLLLVTQLPAN